MNCQLQLDGCYGQATQKHHRKLRSQGGGDEAENLLSVCASCHREIHAQPAVSYDKGWIVYSWQDPALVKASLPEPGTALLATLEVLAAPPAEGETCPVCLRRKPHAKKPGSPKTKVSSVRVPIDDAESFEEIVDAAAAHLGFKEQPHWRYRTLLHGLVLAMQETPDVSA
jgi:hypothetical protein